MNTTQTAKEPVKSDITFTDCVESVRYEIEDALERFPDNKDLFLHQVRILLDKFGKASRAANLAVRKSHSGPSACKESSCAY